MLDRQDSASQSLPPHLQLIQMGVASWISAVIYAAAKLGIADHLAAGPLSAVELAGPTGTHAPTLHRLMRTLAGLGILTERDGQRFALTPLGDALQTGAPGAARATVLADRIGRQRGGSRSGVAASMAPPPIISSALS